MCVSIERNKAAKKGGKEGKLFHICLGTSFSSKRRVVVLYGNVAHVQGQNKTQHSGSIDASNSFTFKLVFSFSRLDMVLLQLQHRHLLALRRPEVNKKSKNLA